MKAVITAFQFLTILPVPDQGEIRSDEVGKASAFFPIVGAFQGLVVGLMVYISLMLPLPVTACLIIIVPMLINGGFHMDGVADTADALAVKSTGDPISDRSRRLSVMKDSSTGAIGATALVMTILLKFSCIYSLLEKYPAGAVFPVLFLSQLLAKWIMLPALFHGQPAKDEGLGKLFMDSTGIKELLSGTILALVFTLAAAFFSINPEMFAFCGILSGVLLYLACFLAVGFFRRNFGGQTGDTFGAMSEFSEIFFLLGALIWLPLFS